MSRKLCDSFLSQFQSTWNMLGEALEVITEEKWVTEINGWTYVDVIYHTIIT